MHPILQMLIPCSSTCPRAEDFTVSMTRRTKQGLEIFMLVMLYC